MLSKLALSYYIDKYLNSDKFNGYSEDWQALAQEVLLDFEDFVTGGNNAIREREET